MVLPGEVKAAILVPTENHPTQMKLVGNYLYVANNWGGGIQIFDISNIAAPVLKTTVNNIPTAMSLDVVDKYAYVLGYDVKKFFIFDISVPSLPVLKSITNVGLKPRRIVVQGNYAYIVNDQDNTLMIFDVSNPSAPILISTTTTDNFPRGLGVVGNYVYITCSNVDNLLIYDISNPSAPVLKSRINTDDYPRNLVIKDNYVYLVNADSRTMDIFDVRNPQSPSRLSTIYTDGQVPRSVEVDGNYAYVGNAESDTVKVFNISNKASPVLVKTIATGQYPISTLARDGWLYIANADDNKIQIEPSYSTGATPTIIPTTQPSPTPTGDNNPVWQGEIVGEYLRVIIGSQMTTILTPAMKFTKDSNFSLSMDLSLDGPAIRGSYFLAGVKGKYYLEVYQDGNLCAWWMGQQIECTSVASNWNTRIKLDWIKSGTNMKLYVNGAEKISRNLSDAVATYVASDYFQVSNFEADINGWFSGWNGKLYGVKVYDKAIVVTRAKSGDATGDEVVNLADFVQWKREFTGALTTKTADFNNDGSVSLADFVVWKKNL